MNGVISLVLQVDQFSSLFVLVLVLFRLVDHVLNFILGKTSRRLDLDVHLSVGGLILGRDDDDTVGINIEGDFDLWNSSWGWGNSAQIELSQKLVVSGHLSLSLEDSDGDDSLVVGSSRVNLGLLGGNGGVSLNHLGHNSSQGLNSQREWSNIDEEDILDGSLHDSSLDGSSDGDGFIGVDGFVWGLSEELLDEFLDLGHSGHTSDQDDFLDFFLGDSGVLNALFAWLESSLQEGVNQRLELGSGDLEVQVLWSRSISSQVWQVDFSLGGRGELNLGLFSSLSDSLDGHLVLLDIDSGLGLELINDPVGDDGINVLSSARGISVGGLDLEDSVVDFENGDIESTTSQIVDGDNFSLVLIHSVSQGGSGWLVDDSENIESGDFSGVLGSLSLGVIEVGWDGDDGLRAWLSEVGISGFLHLHEDEGSDLGWGVLLSSGFNPGISAWVSDNLIGESLKILLDHGVIESSSDKSLGSVDGVFWVGDGLSLGWGSDDSLFISSEGDNGWSSSLTFGIFENLGSGTFHDGNTRVGGSQIDTDDVLTSGDFTEWEVNLLQQAESFLSSELR